MILFETYESALAHVMAEQNYTERRKILISMCDRCGLCVDKEYWRRHFWNYYNYQRKLKTSRDYVNRKYFEKTGKIRKETIYLRVHDDCETPYERKRQLIRNYNYFMKFKMTNLSAMLNGLTVK